MESLGDKECIAHNAISCWKIIV